MPVRRHGPAMTGASAAAQSPVRNTAQAAQTTQTAQTTQRTVKTARQQSLITRIYINLRWFHHFVPLLGLVIILFGIWLAVNNGTHDIVVAQTVIAAGGIISYVAIYYNKTR